MLNVFSGKSLWHYLKIQAKLGNEVASSLKLYLTKTFPQHSFAARIHIFCQKGSWIVTLCHYFAVYWICLHLASTRNKALPHNQRCTFLATSALVLFYINYLQRTTGDTSHCLLGYRWNIFHVVQLFNISFSWTPKV